MKSLPHQIYCDYLEDKGIDCRLLRIEEEEGLTLTNSHVWLDWWHEPEYDIGYGYGWADGNGFGAYLENGDGFSPAESFSYLSEIQYDSNYNPPG